MVFPFCFVLFFFFHFITRGIFGEGYDEENITRETMRFHFAIVIRRHELASQTVDSCQGQSQNIFTRNKENPAK